jgi:hypothetical protein
MNTDSYNYHSFLVLRSKAFPSTDRPDIEELMAACELLADLGDEFSWQLVFELAGWVDSMGVVSDYQRGWRNRQSMRKHLLKAMQHQSPKGEES